MVGKLLRSAINNSSSEQVAGPAAGCSGAGSNNSLHIAAVAADNLDTAADTHHRCFVDAVALGLLQPGPSPLLHPEEQPGKQGGELGGDVHVRDNPSCPAQLAEHSAGCWDWEMNISVWVDLKNRENIIGEKANPEKLSYGWNWPSSEL